MPASAPVARLQATQPAENATMKTPLFADAFPFGMLEAYVLSSSAVCPEISNGFLQRRGFPQRKRGS
jgi:hypothetical protein